MSQWIATFPRRSEFDKAQAFALERRLPHQVIDPAPAYERVGAPSLVVGREARGLMEEGGDRFTCSGWVPYRPSPLAVPTPPPSFEDDVFGAAAVMVLAPCVADERKVRLVAHLSGDLGEALPYVNAEMHGVSYNPDGGTLTFMDGCRMISLYTRRIALAKADDLVDAWRCLEAVRCRVNGIWARRGSVRPSYERRARPPALEVYSRLPKTNCRACGQTTCMAFALQLWSGAVRPELCRPIYGGDFGHLRPAFEEVCAGLGVRRQEHSA